MYSANPASLLSFSSRLGKQVSIPLLVISDDTIIIALEETYERDVTKMKLEEIIKNM